MVTFPDALDAVQFGRIGRQTEQLDAVTMLGEPTLTLLVELVAGAVIDDEEGFAARAATDKLLEEVEERAIGLGLRGVKRGALEIIYHLPLECSIDALAEKLFEAVARQDVQRVVIDGVGGFRMSSVFPSRLPRFFSAHTNELRTRGVTTLLTEEIDLFTPRIESHGDVSPILDNLLLLRHVELRSHLHRLFSVLKVRESDYDSSMQELRITSKGIKLAKSSESAEALLSGLARAVAKDPEVFPEMKTRGSR